MLLQSLVCAAVLSAAPDAKIGLVPKMEVGSNLILDGIPEIPRGVVDRIRRYNEARSATFTDWHPSKREMLILTRFADAAQVHRVQGPGATREQLTFLQDPVGASKDSNGAVYQPTRGDFFVYFQDSGGNEQHQLYRFDLGTREAELLTDGKSRNTSPVWKPDGSGFVFSSTGRNGKDFDLYTATGAKGSKPKLLAEVSGMFGADSFSRDGKWISVVEYLSANESNLYLFDSATGERKRINPEGEKASYDSAEFAHDGKSLFVVTNRGNSEFKQLQRYELATQKWTPLTANISWDISDTALSHDGKTLAFLVNEDGFSRLYLMDARTGKARRQDKLPEGVASGLEWHRNNRDLGFTLTGHDNPGDAFSLDARTGAVTRWTFSEPGPVNPEEFSPAERITWKGHDGLELHGIMYRPPKRFTGPRPVLLAHRGGPEAQSRPVYIGSSNYYLNELGMAVIYLNIRGSPGYGRSYLAADDGMKRDAAYKDVGALLDWVAQQPHLDKSKVIFTGGSYGGHLSLMTAYMYPDRILANIDNVGISSFLTFLKNTAEYRRDLRRVEYGDERDATVRAWMEKTAPLNNVDKIKKPMLVIQGKNDPRVPISEADQMVRMVRERNVPVWYLVATDEGHGFHKKSNALVQLAVTAEFLGKVLEGGAEALKPAAPTAPPTR